MLAARWIHKRRGDTLRRLAEYSQTQALICITHSSFRCEMLYKCSDRACCHRGSWDSCAAPPGLMACAYAAIISLILSFDPESWRVNRASYVCGGKLYTNTKQRNKQLITHMRLWCHLQHVTRLWSPPSWPRPVKYWSPPIGSYMLMLRANSALSLSLLWWFKQDVLYKLQNIYFPFRRLLWCVNHSAFHSV